MRRSVCVALLFGACLLAGGSAAAQLVTVPDLDATTSSVISTVTSTADELVGTAGDAVGDAADGLVAASGSEDASSESTTSSGGASSAEESGSGKTRGDRSSRPHAKTRFDRLPRRLEALLERIEFGRHVRANLRRLERVLASASPELRRRVLRLIREEIARLKRHDTTPAERWRIERLRLALERLREGPAPISGPAAATGPAGSAVPAQAQVGPEPSAGALGERAKGANPQPPPVSTPPPPAIPSDGDGPPLVVSLLILFLVALGIAGLIGGVATHLGRARSG